jgi:hypothetical protein
MPLPNKLIMVVVSLACLALIGYAALGPAKLVPRTGLGWQVDHFTGYFCFTTLLCGAWRRTFAVGGGTCSLAIILEIFQGLTPDRTPDVMGAFYSISGVFCATLVLEFFIRYQQQAPLGLLRRV